MGRLWNIRRNADTRRRQVLCIIVATGFISCLLVFTSIALPRSAPLIKFPIDITNVETVTTVQVCQDRKCLHEENVNELGTEECITKPYSLGCWIDSLHGRPFKTELSVSVMTPWICMQYCGNRTNIFAGIKNGKHCWCGQHIGDYIPSTECNIRCPGDNSLQCGGKYSFSVYLAGNRSSPMSTWCKEPRRISIMAYQRSGSSFTGEFFHSHLDAFYTYEPLWEMELYGLGVETPMDAALVIHRLHNCNFTDIIENLLIMKQAHMWNGIHELDALMPYMRCTSAPLRQKKHMDCLQLADLACKQASIRVTKSVRMTGEIATELYKLDPKSKIIHLTRDPRGVYISRKHAGIQFLGTKELIELSFTKYVDVICSTYVKNMNTLTSIPRTNLITTRYEDIAERPMEMADKLFNFVGVNLSKEVKHWIHDSTRAKKEIKSLTTFKKSNSAATAYKWKSEFVKHYKDLQTIDNLCKSFYKMAGYIPITSMSQIRDESFKPIEDSPNILSWQP